MTNELSNVQNNGADNDDVQLQLQISSSSSNGKIDEDTSSDSSNNEEDEDSVSSFDEEPIRALDCNGCGLRFPSCEEGADTKFAMLCGRCNQEPKSSSTSPPAGVTVSTTEVIPITTSSSANSKEGDEGTTNVPSSTGAPATTTPTVSANSGEDRVNTTVVEEPDACKEYQCGREMAVILANVRDNGIDRYDVNVAGMELAFVPVLNAQDSISKKCRKYFSLLPDPTPLLFGFKHYHGILNTFTKRGWIGHCRLTTSLPNAVGTDYVLWEIWVTRCDRPRIDGIVLTPDADDVILIEHIENWLIMNDLSCDMSKNFDHELFKEKFDLYLKVNR